MTCGSTAATRAADLLSEKRQRGQCKGQKRLQLLQGEPSLLVNTNLKSFPTHTMRSVVNHVKSDKEMGSFAVAAFYLSVFRHISYWCKLKQTYIWLNLKGCLLLHWFRNRTFQLNEGDKLVSLAHPS